MPDKRSMTKAERRNNERMKAGMRCMIEELIASQEVAMRAYMEALQLSGQQFLLAQVTECENRIGVLRWILFMLRPDDPNTINQWNMNNGTQTDLESGTHNGSCPQSANEYKRDMGVNDKRDTGVPEQAQAGV